MLVKDFKVGQRINVPIDSNLNFSFDADGKLLKNGSYVLCTILRNDPYTSVIAWNDERNINATGIRYNLISRYPALAAQYPKLTHCIDLNNTVQCQLASLSKSESANNSFGVLLALISCGALLSSVGQNQIKKEERNAANRY